MKVSTWQVAGIGLGLVGSLLYSTLLGNLPIVQRLELAVQDNLIRLHKPTVPPNEILLVAVDQSSARHKHTFYADLVNRLIAKGAKVVVLNLPTSLRRPLDSNLEAPIKDLVKKNSNQIVLVVYASRQLDLNPSALSIYYHLLPFSDREISPLVSPEETHGFFEYDPNPNNLASPARQAYLARSFLNVEDFHKTHDLKSIAVLALEKFSPPLWNKVRSQVALDGQSSLTQSTVQINFWESAQTFSQIDIKSLCIPSSTTDRCVVPLNAPEAQIVRNKIVLIDLPQEYLDTFGTLSPFGNMMSVAEVQASLIASLMTNSFRRTMPEWCDYTITILGAAFICWLIATQIAKSKFSYSFRNILFLLSVVGVYTSLSFLLSWHRLILPLTVPLLTWVVTGVTVAICLLIWQKQQQLAQQQRKLAERQAILSQARKLLHRVASDIHHGPLQELKLVMDGIELLALNNPTINPNPLLDRLEAIGLDLRDRLRNTRTMAEKLEITPELHAGLDKGIRQHLQQLVSSRELSLRVEDNLQPLLELGSDSSWIDAREDIFRFYKEAIANVIRHAQPPNGTATRITVSLDQQGIQCTLLVENDAIQPEHPTLDTSRKKHSGRYGTKLMATIAAELPSGYWERTPLAKGGMQVILTWTLEATNKDKTED